MIIFNLGEGVLKCVLGWCLPKDYQKLESPRPDSPVHVDINVEILDILSVNDKEFSISMSMYFSVMWQESRIVTNNTIESGFWYPVSLEFLNDLWIPNVFIYNLKSFSSLQVLKRLAGECQSGSDCNYWILNIFIFEKSRTTEYWVHSHLCENEAIFWWRCCIHCCWKTVQTEMFVNTAAGCIFNIWKSFVQLIYCNENWRNIIFENIFSGVWIIDGKDVFYNQFAQVTFLCPMRFERYPLDEHICKFRVGSTNMDINYMRFGETAVTYDESSRNTILDYKVEAMKLREEDRILLYQGGNYSVTGERTAQLECCRKLEINWKI